MNQLQILSALTIAPCQLTKGYAKQLFNLCKLVKELKELPGYMVLLDNPKGNFELVKELPELVYPEIYNERHRYFDIKKQQDNCKEIYGLFTEWNPIEILHGAGSYKFALPLHNDFYYYFLDLIGAAEIKPVAKIDIVDSITIDSAVFKNMNKAIKFVSKDDLRPAMTCVCLAMDKYKVEVVATDCHRLYQSPIFECSQDAKLNLLISTKDAKELAKMKFADPITEINILKNNQIEIAGKIIDVLDAKFPDYKVVIPEYDTYMEFNKEQFVSNVKQVLPFANKVTSQVTFHLNGSIALNAQDVDFSFESNKEMPYLTKNFVDTDIAFNGKFLLDAMDIFKDKTVKMYSEGQSSKAAIFSNGTDKVLVMPLMINN